MLHAIIVCRVFVLSNSSGHVSDASSTSLIVSVDVLDLSPRGEAMHNCGGSGYRSGECIVTRKISFMCKQLKK